MRKTAHTGLVADGRDCPGHRQSAAGFPRYSPVRAGPYDPDTRCGGCTDGAIAAPLRSFFARFLFCGKRACFY